MAHPSKSLSNLPVTGLVALIQAALGCGLGVVIAPKLGASERRAAAIALFSVGLLSTVPLAVSYVAKALNRPESARAMKQRLESIREDSGFPDDAEIY